MTTLELTIYPFQNEQYPSGYRIKRDGFITRIGATRRAESKHLTDTELAAEYWKASLTHSQTDGFPGTAAIANAFHRFATHPNYFEETQ